MRWDTKGGVGGGSGNLGIGTAGNHEDGDNGDREIGTQGELDSKDRDVKNRDSGDQEAREMVTLRHSGNRDTGNRVLNGAALVKPLIPLARISKIAQKDSQHGHLPCVIFLKVARWWRPSQ